MIVSAVPSTARGTVGVVTSQGRLIRLSVLELPALPPTAHAPGLSGGAPVGEFVGTERGRDRGGHRRCRRGRRRPRAGHRHGVVKRVAPDYPQNASEFEVIALKDGDSVVGAVQLASEDQDLVFITSDAQLLRFGATCGAAAGPGGRRHGRDPAVGAGRVIWFGAVDPEAARERPTGR